MEPRCWHLTSPGGVGLFYFGSSYSFAISGGTGSIYRDKGAKDNTDVASSAPAYALPFGASEATTPVVIASARAETAASRFYFGADPPLVCDVAT